MTPEATMASTVEATEMPSSTALIPDTGAEDPGRISNLLTYSVFNQTGDEIGKVNDLVVDLAQHQVEYVLVNAVDHVVALPWRALQSGSGASQSSNDNGTSGGFTLMVDQSTFDNAPAIQTTAIPAVGEVNADWDADIRAYWQNILPETASAMVEPTMDATKVADNHGGALLGVVRASELLGYGIDFTVGSDMVSTSVDDGILDDQNGELQYLVVSVKVDGAENMLIPIPLSVIRWDDVNKVFTLSTSILDIAKAPAFMNGEYPDTQTSDWDTAIQSYWDNLSVGQ